MFEWNFRLSNAFNNLKRYFSIFFPHEIRRERESNIASAHNTLYIRHPYATFVFVFLSIQFPLPLNRRIVAHNTHNHKQIRKEEMNGKKNGVDE